MTENEIEKVVTKIYGKERVKKAKQEVKEK